MSQGQQPPSIDELRAQVSQMLDSLPANVPIAAIVLFEVNPAKEDGFIKNANALTEATRRLPGCNVFAFHKIVKAGPASTGIEYLIYEDWQTRDLFRTQWDSDHLQRFQHAVGDLIVATPDLRFYFGWSDFCNMSTPTACAETGPNGSSRNSYSSLFSFPLAMSFLGLEQMTTLAKPGKMASALDNVTRAAEAGLSDPLKMAFRAADALQRAALGLMLDTFSGPMLGPRRWTGMASDFFQRSVAATETVDEPASAGSRAPSQPVSQSTPASSTQPQSAAGWGPMPYPVPIPSAGSSSPSPPAVSSSPGMGEPDISPDFPYDPHYVSVLGSRMHYIEQGSGETILLLHGNPSWSYIWRNIIPHLSSLGRCIAPDLIGFGRSDKPEIEYLWRDHVRYLEGFIETMGLHDMTLVLHDQGSGLGFHYAMHNQDNVRAIAFFEAIVRPYPWEEFSTPEFREIFRKFRTGGVGGEGWQMLVEQNVFIEQLLPQAAGRPLTQMEMNFYREPFRTLHSRIPIWRFPRQTPIGGEPADVWDAVTEYSERLQRSEIPKFMLYASPGALLTDEHVAWCQHNINNLESIYIGPGLHFLQESSPHRIGSEIAKWYRNLRC